MKKLVCMALSAALLTGSVPAYAADYITKVLAYLYGKGRHNGIYKGWRSTALGCADLY